MSQIKLPQQVAEQDLHALEQYVKAYIQTEDAITLEKNVLHLFNNKQTDTNVFEWSRIEEYLKIIGHLCAAVKDNNEKIIKMRKGQLIKFYNNV